MAEGIARHAAAQGVKKLAFIGFNNALGETFWVEVEKAAKKHGIELVGRELRAHGHLGRGADPQAGRGGAGRGGGGGVRHAGRDAAGPRAATRARSISTTAWPTTTSCASAAACEGAWVPVGPVMVAGLLPDSHPVKASAQAFAAKYEAVHGAGSVSLFAAYTWDVALLLQQAVPVALKAARPARRIPRGAARRAGK